jgi:hypothetical protein
MVVGIREYKLSNPLDEKKEDLIHNAIIQYIAEE